jgi:hypothetical protein
MAAVTTDDEKKLAFVRTLLEEDLQLKVHKISIKEPFEST